MKRILFALLLVMTLGLQVDEAQPAPDLTGIWNCNDGGKYYLRQTGANLWWLGESQDKGGTWTNVYQGQIQGTEIRGRWADVPQGRIMGSGEMILQINNPDQLTAVSKTGGFGGSLWTRQEAVPPSPPMTNFALASNGGTVVSGFTGWSTPRTLVNDAEKGPDDPNPTSTAKDGIAAYSVGPEPFQVNFRQPVEIHRIGIMHKLSGGAGGRDIIRQARLVFSDGSSLQITFTQTYGLQYVEIPPKVTRFIRVEQLNFYPGNDRRWGVIEFEAWGHP